MSNIYRIGVSIAMASNGAQVLGGLSRHILGLHVSTEQLTRNFGRMRLAIGGAFAVAAGVGILKGINALSKASEDLSREQARMRAAGLSAVQVAEATGKAWEMSGSIMGARVSENLAAISHLRAALGDLHEAQIVAPSYQRNAVALEAITGKPGEQQAYQMAQAIHLSGAANDPVTHKLRADLFSAQMNLYTAMVAAGGGKLASNDLLNFQKRAGSFGGSLSNEGRVNLIGYIQSTGGDKAGTALTATNRALLAGVMPKAVMQTFADMGLLDTSKIKALSKKAGKGADSGAVAGGNVRFLPGALKNEAEFIKDPMGWVWSTLRPQLVARGLKTVDEQVNWVNKSKLGINPSRFLAEGLRNEGVDRQEAANVRLAGRTDQYKAAMATSLPANREALHKAFKDMMTAFATPLVPAAIKTMQAVTSIVKSITKWSVANPGAIKIIAGTLVVLGAALVGFGVVAVGVAAFAAVAAGGTVGLVIAAIGAVVGGVTALVVLNWQRLGDFFTGVKTAIGNFFKWITDNPVSRAIGRAFAGPENKGEAFRAGFQQSVWSGPNSAVPPPAPANQNIQLTHQTILDGRVLATTVSKHQANSMGSTIGGLGRFDPGAGLPAVSGSYF